MSSENAEVSAAESGPRPDGLPTSEYPPYPWGYPPATSAMPYPPYQPYPSYAPYPNPYYYPAYGYGYYSYPTPQTSGWAIASLICSIAGMVMLGVIFSVVGVIFGHIAMREIKNSNGWRGGQGMALAGLIVGYIGLGLSLIVLTLYFLYLTFIVTLFQSYPTTDPTDFVPHLLTVVMQIAR